MKRYFVGILSAAFILGAGTAVFAAGNSNSGERVSLEKMLPFMQKMHPDSSKAELKDMYKACHEGEGMMSDKTGREMDSENMMNSF